MVFTFAERLRHGQGYHLHFINADEKIYAEDLQVAAEAVNLGVETCIRIVPEQYQWSYKRLKTRPKGEPNIY